jgi:hypothetical protein
MIDDLSNFHIEIIKYIQYQIAQLLNKRYYVH